MFAQGYNLPDQPDLTVTYSVDPKTLMLNSNETSQAADLGRLRASIELMYSLIKEKRINELIQNNSVKWSAQELDKKH